ncbi:MAG TPA: hypothetical protein VMZ53_29005 [Kofleriaceae bacterium]|nr:hypothetical protein [Kofleriaceae bacterium]
MRATLALLLAACGSSKSVPQTTPTTTTTPTISTTPGSTGPAVYPPPDLSPPTTGLAVGIAAHVVIDDRGSRLFVRKANGIDILALDSGKKTGRIDIGWDGELWPAGAHVLALRIAPSAVLEVALVDPATNKIAATCSGVVAVPANSQISRVDEFTTHAGTTYLQWETSPPPRRMGGAAVSDEQMAAITSEFRAAYACGLFAIHTNDSRCTLDKATPQEAGLEACGSRSMPWNRYLPSPIGKLALRVDRSSAGKAGLLVDTDTLVISELGGSELWKLPIETRAIEPPPP